MDAVWEHPKVALWELPGPPPAVPPGLAPADAYRFAVEAPYAAYAAKHGKPDWADKTPHYVHHVDHLLRVWPDARFVVLVRDGRDVAALAPADAVRPEQRLGRRAVVGARDPRRAARRRAPPRRAC